MSFSLSNCKYDFSSDNINIITLLYDESGSMSGDREAMLIANQAFYSDFSKFEEKGSIAISKAVFSESFDMWPFKDVKSFNTDYKVYGNTYLYNAICSAASNTIAYYNEIVKRLNVRPRITFLVFTDGIAHDDDRFNEAKAWIKKLNLLDATTVFVAFRDAISNESGNQLGFSCTRNITNVRDLISTLGTELSKSCKEQSRSSYSLKSAFFSTATTDSKDDDESSPIGDDDFFNI